MQENHPVYAREVKPKHRPILIIVFAVIAGLAVGISTFVFLRARSRSESPSLSQTAAKVSPETTPSSVTPPPESDLLPAARRRRPTAKQSSRKTTQPPIAAPESTPPTPVIAQTETGPASNSNRRRAVQETDMESSPLPNTASSTAAAAEAPQPAPEPHLTTHPQFTPAPTPARATQPQAPPVAQYAGPSSGVATWTGKLDKNQTLAITAGTPSTGILSGAGLPGVPVRITVEQSNLGFVEMPSAANHYRRLVLRSHSKHDKITIHWTVIH